MECSAKVADDVTQFMNEAGINEAFLFGGAVIDPLIKENAQIHDYDICVRDADTFYSTIKALNGKGYKISEVMRTHNIYTVIKHDKLGQIDFSCMNPEDNGIFNIEKIFAEFKRQGNNITCKVIDNYGAVDAIKNGKIRLACRPEKEGAYNILRRFLAVVGKYDIDTSKNGINQETIDAIKKEFEENRAYIPQDKVRCLSRVVASLHRSKDRKKYVTNLGKQHIFLMAFPELDRLFNEPKFQESQKLQDCKTQKDLLKLMVGQVQDINMKESLVDCLLILARREAARQDQGVKEFVSEKEQEPTSVNRVLNLLRSVRNAKER